MSRLFLLLSLFVSSYAQAVPVYEVAGGKLTGISEVEVGGVLYDVTFQNGSFSSIYGDPSNLTFTNYADAFTASTTLLSLMVDGIVASDGNTYNLDTNNGMVGGCANYVYCDMLTTYGVFTDATGVERAASSSARNFYDVYSDFVTGISLTADYDTSPLPWYTYAVWTESTPVPEASGLVLLGLGLLGFGFARRKAS